jgi:spore coat protein CotH
MLSRWAVCPGLFAVFFLSCSGNSVRIPDADAGAADSDADVDGDCDSSVVNTPPDAPSIVAPAAGTVDVIGDELVVTTSPFSDADADRHVATEAEIWLAPGGARVERIWRATNEARLTTIVLADGAFEGSAVGGELPPLAELAVRVRYEDDGGGCTAWSDWSAEVPFRADDGSTYFFDGDEIREFELEIPPASWDAMNAEAYPPGCVQFIRHYQPATLIFEGVRYDDVGVRLKGGCGSSRDLNRKASFKINLNWDDPAVPGCPDDRRIHGLTHFTLNNGVQDWTEEHEELGYAFYRRMGVPAPRAGHAKVTVNGVYYGLYSHVETPDRRYLRRWFDDASGMMYEGAYWCDLVPGNVPDALDAWSCFDREFTDDACDDPDSGDDPADWELLRQLTQDIEDLPAGGFYTGIQAFFDFDTFLSMWAVEGVLAHWDAYSFHIINNYRVYHDPTTGIWTMMPWGIDQTFRGDLDPWSTDALLVRRCLGERACEDAFAARLDQAASTFEDMDLEVEAQRLYDVIAPDLRDDPRKEYDNTQYAAAYAELRDWIPRRPGRVREYLAWYGF